MNNTEALHVAGVARPGDTVLIGFDRTLSDDELADLREQFGTFLDTTKVHLAFVEHVTSMVVVKGSDAEDECCVRDKQNRHSRLCRPEPETLEGAGER